jgi:hypothetical protein
MDSQDFDDEEISALLAAAMTVTNDFIVPEGSSLASATQKLCEMLGVDYTSIVEVYSHGADMSDAEAEALLRKASGTLDS